MASSKKASRGKSNKAEAGRGGARRVRTGAGAVQGAQADAPLDEDALFTLDKAHAALGKPDGALEAALRAVHRDEELRAEGVKVLSERIVRDGERLCSKALAHLESKDADVVGAARRAGLTRMWVVLTVDALVRLRGESDRATTLQKASEGRAAKTKVSLGDSLARGRRLRRQAVERLKLPTSASPELSATLATCRRAPDDVDKMASQLEALAGLVDATLGHPDAAVKTLAISKGLEARDAEELREVVAAIRGAREEKGRGGAVKRDELQALLDVLDGFCLLLLGEVLKALREMAEVTAKVKRPVLYSLATYFDGSAPAEPTAPAPQG